MKGGLYVLDNGGSKVLGKSFWDRLRVKALLDKYLEGYIEYAKQLQVFYSLTDKQTIGVLNMTISVQKLSELTKMWKTVTPIAGGYVNVPDGDYVGDLKEMVIQDAKASGRLQVASSFEIVDGEQEGKIVKCFDGLDNATSAGHFRHKCEVIGLDLPEDAKLWQEVFDTFIADSARVDLYNITMKTNKGKDGKDYSNLYVNGISEFTKGDEAAEGAVDNGEVEMTQEELDAQEQAQADADAQAQADAEAVAAQQIPQPRRVVAARPVAQVAKPVARVAAPVVRVAAKPVAPVAGVRKIIAKR